MVVEKLKKVDAGWRGEAWLVDAGKLVKFNDLRCTGTSMTRYFVVSQIPEAWDTGKPETLVFPCDKNGKTYNTLEVCGGSCVSIDEAIAELDALPGEPVHI
jgi:hypothetical protein